jgi:hypothetical protein
MSSWHMNLGEVIDFLREQDPTTPVADGFGSAHSYRGHYERVSFSPLTNTTVGAMLAEAEKADGATFYGYKGGEYRMGRRTLCHVAEYGECPDGDELTLRRLQDMVSPPAVVSPAELSALRAVAQAAERVERVIDYRLYKHSAPAAEAMLAMRTALAALPPAGKGRP